MPSYNAFAEVYDILTQNVDYAKRGAYFGEIFRKYGKTEGVLVDLACGTGTLSEYFSTKGYEVVGVDQSEEMLAQALEKKMASGSDTIYLCQPLEDLDLFGTADVFLCALDSLNHITEKETLLRVLEKVSLFMHEDAIFVFDVNTVYKHERILADQTFVYDMEEVYCVWQNRLQEEHRISITLDLFFYEEQEDCYVREQEEFSERAYTMEEWEELLDKAGFRIESVYAADTFTPPQPDTQRLVYVVKNRECKNQWAQE